jgi:hypothetical protein
MNENNVENNNQDNKDNEKQDIENVNSEDLNQDSEEQSSENNEEAIENHDDTESKTFEMPENMNWGGVLTWGIVSLIFSILLVFLVSLISGTLQFILGRLFLFGILFFILGAGLRLLIEIFAPDIFNEEENIDNVGSGYNRESDNSMVNSMNKENNDMLGSNINTSIDDQIETDPLWKEKTEEKEGENDKELTENEKIKKKYGGKADDYINVQGTDVVIPNNAELMAESIRTMINKDEE